MWKHISHVLFRTRAAVSRRFCVAQVLCLAVLSAVVVLSVMHSPLRTRPDTVARPKRATSPIPYRSNASVYQLQARYVAPLPRGKLHASKEVRVEHDTTPPRSQQPPPRGVHTRAQRQEALEEEIEKYLSAHGIHRARRTRVRFVIVANRVDAELCNALGSAALAGTSIPLAGFDAPYSHFTRYKKCIAFAEGEGLEEDDIVVKMDSDIIWTGADILPFLSKFARFSPEKEADLDVAAVRAWEDYGEKKAPLFMKELEAQAEATGGGAHTKRPAMQMAPIITNGEHPCWWGQHSKGFVPCQHVQPVLDHLIEVARNHVSSYPVNKGDTFFSEHYGKVRATMTKLFPGASSWMMDDVLHQPNTLSPYTTMAQRGRNDPLFYRLFAASPANPKSLNGGVQVARVWALRRFVTTLDAFLKATKPVPGEMFQTAKKWECDQGAMGELYVRARLFEVEHNLLSGPPPSARTPPVEYDPRFGPPGLLGIDRRSEVAVIARTVARLPAVFRQSAYRNWTFPASGGSGAKITEAQLGSDAPTGRLLDNLIKTRSGAFVTPPLLWRSATPEDQARGYASAAEDDADVVHPPIIHYAGEDKDTFFKEQRHFFPWFVAARYDGRARGALNETLSGELVELWYKKERVYIDYRRICPDPMHAYVL